ncbi:ATP-binding protein [Tumebacillus permanentifrigoris]|uniref:histidine kinase n=1 Tax=Tumebacillus permanentifrigoris TaxID=378543 RepID=A0A316D8T9_9BACL|nr:ATP-binding protein [Tumebacillus permanentifrigoris]PWK11220.1 PAS domain S-box-containing protein [Tumebacillus permanentifrigoris]
MKFQAAGCEWLDIQGILTEEEYDPFQAHLLELLGDLLGALDKGTAVELDALLAPYEKLAHEQGYQLAERGLALEDVLRLGQFVRNQLLGDLFTPAMSGSEDPARKRLLDASAALTRYTDQLVLGFHQQEQESFRRRSVYQRNRVLDALPVTVVIYDQDGTCEFANKKCLIDNQQTLGQVQGKHRLEVASLHNANPDPELAWQRVLNGERVRQRIESYGEGGLTLNEKDMVPLRDEQGEISNVIVVTYSSISEKERLYNMQKQFSFVLDSMNSGLLILNSDCCVSGFNQKAQEIFGLQPEKVIGTTLSDLYATYVMEAEPDLLVKLQTLVDEGQPLHGIHKTFQMCDRTLSLRLDGNPILNASGESVGYILIVEDMTELQAMREAMMRNEKFALIGQFAAGIAHEIRNPLTTVFGFLQLFASGSVKHENFADLTRTLLIPELERANIILSDFLMVSKPTAPQRSVVDTAQFFEDVVRLIESEAHLRGVMLQIDTVDFLPPLKVDVQQMKQVFLNLCKNAFDVTPPGGCLRLTAKPQVQGAQVRFDVIDQGPGIQADDLSKIFDPFFTTKEHGTGLGLPISHRIVEGHGGRLKVRSAQGVGTTFTILIPIGE